MLPILKNAMTLYLLKSCCLGAVLIMLVLFFLHGCADNSSEGVAGECPCRIPAGSIAIDGNLDDWSNIEPVIRDPEDDGPLKAAYLARDGHFLYIAGELYDTGSGITYQSYIYFDNNRDNDLTDVEDRIAKTFVNTFDIYNGDNPPTTYNVDTEVIGDDLRMEGSIDLADFNLPDRFLFSVSINDVSDDSVVDGSESVTIICQ